MLTDEMVTIMHLMGMGGYELTEEETVKTATYKDIMVREFLPDDASKEPNFAVHNTCYSYTGPYSWVLKKLTK